MKLKSRHSVDVRHLVSETTERITTTILALTARLRDGDPGAAPELELLSKRLHALAAKCQAVQEAQNRGEMTRSKASRAMRDIAAQVRVAEVEAKRGCRLH